MYKKIIILLGVVLLLGTGSSIIFRTDLVGSAEAGIAYSGKGIDVMVDDSSMHSGAASMYWRQGLRPYSSR